MHKPIPLWQTSTQRTGKTPCLMGKLNISMAMASISNCKRHDQRVCPSISQYDPMILPEKNADCP